jgi:hypothetical protein
MAKQILHDKWVTNEGDIVEIKVWSVSKSEHFPDKIKYSMVFIHDQKRILGYDNERGKGHHEHKFGYEKEIEFKSLEQLLDKFEKAIDEVRGELYGNKNKTCELKN